MAKEITLNTEKISEIGNMLSDKLKECGITNSILTINVDERSLRKIDEDLYFRLLNGEADNYVPTENKLSISFNNLTIFIKNSIVSKDKKY